jgi:hypothetical protein
MSRLIGEELPAEILAAFDGEELDRKLGPAHLLVTTDPDGTPRPCMLSAGEVLAPDERHLRFALWSGSRTCRNLARGGTALFAYVAPGAVLYVRGPVRPLAGETPSGIAFFGLEVATVESDAHAGMPVTSGIAFTVERPGTDEVLAGWRAQLAALAAAR